MTMRRAVWSGCVLALLACGGGTENAVDHVTLEVTNTNPRVGEVTHVGATPVGPGGVKVEGVPCGFVSSAPGTATVDATNGTVTAVAPGTVTITATCPPPNGKSNHVDLTVRPDTVTLTVNKLGNGSGGLFVNPPGNTFDRGTNVTITASPVGGSTFVAWGDACAGTAAASSCALTLNDNTTASGTFDKVERFVSNQWAVDLGNLTDSIGCGYHASATGVLTLDVAEQTNFTVTGTASIAVHVNIVVTGTPANTTCTASPFETDATGPILGNDSALTSDLSNASGGTTMSYTGVRSGTTITGSGTLHRKLGDTAGNVYPTQGSTGTFIATKQ